MAPHFPQLDDLPIIPYLDQITQTIKDNQATVIIGATGSGKTTQVGLHLLKAGLAKDKRIGVTQPRRLAVISLAEFVAQLYDCPVGQEVGYQVRFDDATMEGTKLKFMTDGILLQEASGDPLFGRYNILIFDEAHEQGLNTDIGLGLVKRALAQRPDLRVVIMSATIDTGRFAEYFNNAPIISVEGRTFPISTQYLLPQEHALAIKMFHEYGALASLPALAAAKVQQIHHNQQPGHILIFMPGKKEIGQTIEYLDLLHLPDVLPLPAHSEMDQQEQQQIFQPTDKRKVIVATNIAETSITIDGLAFVIDSGLIRQMIFDHKHGIGALRTIEHSKSGLHQRQGRAGRTQPGTYLALFTEFEYDHGRPEYLDNDQNIRPQYSTPEIQREDLSSAVLRMTELGVTNIEQFDFLNPPAPGAIHNAILALTALGALDQDGHTTKLGQQMATLPVEPRIARMILEAQPFNCVQEILTISASLSTGTIFIRPMGQEEPADQARSKLLDKRGDLFTLLKIIPLYEKQPDREQWAAQNYLSQHVLEEIIKIRDQLHNLVSDLGIPVTWLQSGRNPTARRQLWQLQYDHIGRAITAGLQQNLAVKTSEREYTRLGGSTMRIHPGSVWADKKPPIIVCSEILELNGSTFAVNCQAVELQWIKEIAPHLIQIKQEALHHPWKGNLVGSYTITSLLGIELSRSYSGHKLPQHMIAQEHRHEPNQPKRGQNRHQRRHPRSKNPK